MKVWVPIDLPDGWTVERAFCHDTYGKAEWLDVIGPVEQAPQPEPHRDRWEYAVTPLTEDAYNGMGEQGWEAVSVNGAMMWFKRRLA